MIENYIEIVLNWFIIFYLSLFATIYTLHIKMPFSKMLVVTLLFTILRTTVFVIKNSYLIFTVSVLSYLFISIYIYYSQNTTKLSSILISLCSYTFLIYGIAFVLIEFFKLEPNIKNSIIELPLWVILLCSVVYMYIFLFLLKLFKEKNINGVLIKKVRIKIFNYQINCIGYVDSGNMLYDDKTGLPIIIISMQSFRKICGKENFEKFNKDIQQGLFVKKISEVKYSTLSGCCSSMITIEPEYVQILESNGKYSFKNCRVGFVEKKFLNFDCLLNRELI